MDIPWSDTKEGASFWRDIHIHCIILKKSTFKRPQYIKVSQLKDIYENSKKKS